MIFLYYLGFSLLLLMAGPLLLAFKKKARHGVWQKLGVVPAAVQPKGHKRRVWFHAVSVGEFNAVYPLVQLFAKEHPDCEVFVSTTTGTGQALAQTRVGDWANVFYFPFDVPWAVNAWLDRVQPDMVAIVETEIWPGFMSECANRGIKVCCVNGRISPRSFKQYKSMVAFFSGTVGSFAALAVQSEQEAARYRALGAHPESIYICGNMKFDGIKPVDEAERSSLRHRLNIQKDDVVIVGGSTHEGEESALLDAVTKLSASNRRIRLIIAPRHPERFQRVYQIVESYGFRARTFSRDQSFEQDNDVYVLDTIGQLLKFYSLADIAFVGGTIAPIGGHNIVEPFVYNVPVVCGPHTEKTRDVAYALLERGGLVQLQSADQMASDLLDLITSPQRRQTIGKAGKSFLDNSQGAVQRTMSVLNSVFSGGTAAAAQHGEESLRERVAVVAGKGEYSS
ncbi:MAG TPA: 3-deoxy-D-manno-octulosonic acid transferase [Candidatus Obscuribacterales bacterium]